MSDDRDRLGHCETIRHFGSFLFMLFGHKIQAGEEKAYPRIAEIAPT